MRTTFLKEVASRITLAAWATLLAACVDQPPLAPVSGEWTTPQLTWLPQAAEAATTVATLRRVTARYHNLDAALADGPPWRTGSCSCTRARSDRARVQWARYT